jgi:hypothetical protein
VSKFQHHIKLWSRRTTLLTFPSHTCLTNSFELITYLLLFYYNWK